ncbi:19756_t:CDS:2 [Funneliformis geosporum]|nr:19756_t:CDS:2 [Funneliformis geosporum]
MSSRSFQPQCDLLTERNLRKHTESFDRKSLQEQYILDYVLEQQQINYEESQHSNDADYSSSDSETSRKATLSDNSRYSVEHGLPSINSSLLISKSQLRKSKLSETSEIKKSKPCSKQRSVSKTRKKFSERRSPLRETSLNQRRSKHIQKERDQRNKKFLKKAKEEYLKNYSRSAINTNRRESRESRRSNGMRPSSLIMRNWYSDKLGTDRITLQPDNKAKIGIFNKGKASEKVKTRGVFSEIDFLNSNSSRKRINQNDDVFRQGNCSNRFLSQIFYTKKFHQNEQNVTQISTQDTDEISDSNHRKSFRISTMRIKNKQKQYYSEEKSISSNNSQHLDNDFNSSLRSNDKGETDASSIGHAHVNKISRKRNEVSSHFVSGQKNKKPSKYASRSRKEKKITSSYFASNRDKDCLTPKDKHKPTEQVDNNSYIAQTVDSLRSLAVDAENQSQIDDYQGDSQVDKITPKSEESVVERVKIPMKLNEDSSTKNLQNDPISSEENKSEKMFSAKSDSEKMVVDFNPSWIKRKSLPLNKLSQLQNQSTAKSNEHQSNRIYRAVITEGAKIERSNMTDHDEDKEEELKKIHNNSPNIELGNNDDNVKNICQEMFARDNHMNVDLFDDPIQTYQGHKDYSKCDTVDEQLTLDMQYKSNNALVYGGIDHEGSFEDSNIYTIPTTFEDHQCWTPSNEFPMYESRIIPQTSMMENRVPWNRMVQYQHNPDLIVNNHSSVNNYEQTWEDSINNSLYIDAEHTMYDETNQTSHDEIEGEINDETNMAACFVWRKHRLH